MTRLSWLIATLAMSLFGSSAAHAITCSKAANSMERLICSDSRLRQADAAMNASYLRLLKSTGEEDIKAALIASQRRWLAARDSQLGRLGQGPGSLSGPAWRAIVFKAIRDRGADLIRIDTGDTGLPRMIAMARRQRAFAARFTGGAYAGFQTSCSFVPSGGGYVYGCFGRQHFQNRDRVCSVDQEWASGSVSETRVVERVTNGTLTKIAGCSIGNDAYGSCPNPNASGGQHAVWTAASGTRTPPYPPLQKIDVDIDVDMASDWLPACLTRPDYPPMPAASSQGKKGPKKRRR
ncbi:lysozyme inhibitor LprI family protein [Sphingomonas sp.]|uniref:lysozyme inhibitor LprI family protein n=1 Tax=Sphingomonas sp. TaxID=28214 RepID=UPI003B3A5A86